MKKSPNTNWVELGIFSMGVSYALYAIIQYILTPFCWWLTTNIFENGLINEMFDIFEVNNLEIFTLQSLTYSLIGIVSFFIGYFFIPIKIIKKHSSIISRSWNIKRAEAVFWGCLLSGFAIKIFKVVAGVSIADVVELNIKHGYFADPLITFYLSFNWFHLLALMIINVIYQEAKKGNLNGQRRVKIIAYGYTLFFIFLTLSSGGKAATLFPLLGLLIIKKFYSAEKNNLSKAILSISAVVILIFVVKQLLAEYFEADGYSTGPEYGLAFVLLYNLFNRLNLSHVMAGVIEKGQQAFPNGTLGQFWVDMNIYGMDKANVFDGNEFGRAIGVALDNDYSTGVAVTNMGDLYINFGIMGIIFGMLITGILYKIFFSNCHQRLPFFVMLYALMWPILIHGMESPITVLYSTSIKMISLCLLVHFAIVLKFSRKKN